MSKFNLLLLGLALIAVVLVILIGSPGAREAHSTFFDAASPLLKSGASVREQFGAVGQGLKTLEELEAENRQLLIDNRQMRARLQVLEGLKEENDNLRDALGFVRRTDLRLLAGRVVSRDASTWWNNIRINRGFEDGVEVDMPVITEEGLVGKVVAVSKNLSTVMLVSDENCRVGAQVEGTRERGIVQGRRLSTHPQGELELNFLNKGAPIEPGAKVLTAGVEGGVFPPDLLVGEVVSFRTRELDGQALIRPAVDLSSIRDVFIIVR
jgi:rod shape-determining protein MreC